MTLASSSLARTRDTESFDFLDSRRGRARDSRYYQRPRQRSVYIRPVVNRSLEKSLRISVTRILTKILKTRSNEIVMECQKCFSLYTVSALIRKRLECGPMPNLMVALPNIRGALCSTPQSLADAHY